MRVVTSIVLVIVLCNLALASAVLYLLPVLIGWVRRVPHIGSIAAINVLLGWTLIGWVTALAIALRSVREAGAAVQIVQNLPASPAAVPPEDRAWAGRPGPYPYRDGTPPPLELPPRPGPGSAA